MGAVPSPILLLPLPDLIGVDVDDQLEEAEGEDGDDHVLPLRLPVHKDSQHQQSIAQQEWLDHSHQPADVPDLPVLHLAANVEVRGHEEDERGGQEEDRRDEEGFVELPVGRLLVPG